MGEKSGSSPGSGSRMNNPDNISESLETLFWFKILKFFDVDPGSGINVPDPQHCKQITKRTGVQERQLVKR
jgi:hypothetical protein